MVPAMGDLLYLSRADVERLLDIDAMLEALAAALVAYSSGLASAPPRTAVRVERGLLGVMPGYVPGVALESKLVSVFPKNEEHGLPSHQGLIALFDEERGTPLALMDGTYITAIRTGGTAAVAARVLARQDASVLAILGAGVQGRSHLEIFPRVRDFGEIRVASRSSERASDLAASNPRARAALSFEDAVRGADVVACCTDAREPILHRGARVRARPARWSRDKAASLDLDHPRRHDVHDPGRADDALRHKAPVRVDVAVHVQQRLEVADQAQIGDEADVGRVHGLGDAEGRRVGDQDVELAPVACAVQAQPQLEPTGAPANLA